VEEVPPQFTIPVRQNIDSVVRRVLPKLLLRRLHWIFFLLCTPSNHEKCICFPFVPLIFLLTFCITFLSLKYIRCTLSVDPAKKNASSTNRCWNVYDPYFNPIRINVFFCTNDIRHRLRHRMRHRIPFVYILTVYRSYMVSIFGSVFGCPRSRLSFRIQATPLRAVSCWLPIKFACRRSYDREGGTRLSWHFR